MKSRQRKEWEAQRASRAEREPKPLHRLERPASFTGTMAGPAPKTEPHRNRRLLDLARGAPCLLLVPGCCNHRLDTTVPAHSNWPEHGKAGARKADDEWTCWACFACHSWLDQGGAPAQQKRAVFMAGMGRQLTAWRLIAADPGQPEADRRAARWALDRHGEATR